MHQQTNCMEKDLQVNSNCSGTDSYYLAILLENTDAVKLLPQQRSV